MYKPDNCPTNFGMLLLGKAPTLFIGGAYIQYVKFEGTHRATKVLKEVAFKSNLLKTLKDIDNFVHYTIENQRPVYVTMMREDMKINYPYRAMREIVMNSIMHRSFEGTNSPIRFYEYSDRIEIDNPGNLYGRVNIENFPNETDYRNPLIASAMKILGYVNQFGIGLKTGRETLEQYGCKPAEYVLNDYTTFKVIVYNSDDVADMKFRMEDSDSLAYKILSLVTENPKITRAEIAEHCGVSTKTIERQLAQMKDKIEFVGASKNGYWQIKD